MRIYSYQSPSAKPAKKAEGGTTNKHKLYTPKSDSMLERFKAWILNRDWKKIGTWTFRAAAAGILAMAILFIYVSRSLPDPNRLLGRDVPQSTKIYDRNGILLYEVHGEIKRTLINLDEMSPYVQKATISAEDRNFYNHSGISIKGTVRSIIVDILAGEKKQGGSTITQQFVKNAVLTTEKSYWRKIKEIILSLEIETKFSKDEILKLYLNEIPYGRNAYGIEAASETYFGKKAKDLTLAESAYLAALPQAPTHYNPNGNYRNDLEDRKNYILTQMKELGYITQDQFDEATAEQVTFKPATNSISAPYFVLYIEDYLATKYGDQTLQEGGLKVYTTLDSTMQTQAEKAITEGVVKYDKPRGANNAALVAIDPKTGQILAMVGGKDYFGEPEPAGCTPGKNCVFEPNVNVATSPRQPGSSFKPFVYLTAFSPEHKYSPASMLMDVTTNFGNFGGKDYIPQNYSGENFGPVSMRKALAGSLNIPAVKTLALVGVDNAVQTAHDLGITAKLDNCGLSLVLGGCEVKLLDHVASYAAIANMGNRHEKTGILKVESEDGKVLEEYQDKSQQVVDPQAAYELINIMTDNSARSYIFGSNSPLTLPDRTIGCKTGTTQSWHDGWTLCFTPSLAVGVWSGNNNGALLKPGSDGVFVAAPIVNQFMKAVLKGTPAEEFKIPQGITKVTVDSVSGKLPNQYTPSTKSEVFADYAVPKDTDPVHVGVKIDTTTGERATDLTPAENIGYKVFTVFHSEKPDSPNWENPVIAWAKANGYDYPNAEGPLVDDSDKPQVTITNPADGSTIAGTNVKITVNATSQTQIAKVEIAIDGDIVATLTTAPYTTTLNQKLNDGNHTVTARATDKNGISNDTSNVFTVGNAAQTINLTQPGNNSLLAFPVTLTAETNTPAASVSFYYQLGNNGTPKLIGTGDSQGSFSAPYEYSLEWKTKPTSGNYKVFAKTDKGTTSNKISVSVP